MHCSSKPEGSSKDACSKDDDNALGGAIPNVFMHCLFEDKRWRDSGKRLYVPLTLRIHLVSESPAKGTFVSA